MRWLTWAITLDKSSLDDATRDAWKARVAAMRTRHGDGWADLMRAAVRQQRRFALNAAPKHGLFAEPIGVWTLEDLIKLSIAPGDLTSYIADRYPEKLRAQVAVLGLPFLQSVMLIAMSKPALALEPLLELPDGPLVWLERARVARTLGYPRSVEAALEACRVLVDDETYQALVATTSGAQDESAG